jgi:hypothetical protein
MTASIEGRRPSAWMLVLSALLSACGTISTNTKLVEFSKLSPRVANDVTRVMVSDSHKISRCADPIRLLIRTGERASADVVIEIYGERGHDIDVRSAAVGSRFGSEFNACVESALRSTVFVPAHGDYAIRVSMRVYIDSDVKPRERPSTIPRSPSGALKSRVSKPVGQGDVAPRGVYGGALSDGDAEVDLFCAWFPVDCSPASSWAATAAGHGPLAASAPPRSAYPRRLARNSFGGSENASSGTATTLLGRNPDNKHTNMAASRGRGPASFLLHRQGCPFTRSCPVNATWPPSKPRRDSFGRNHFGHARTRARQISPAGDRPTICFALRIPRRYGRLNGYVDTDDMRRAPGRVRATRETLRAEARTKPRRKPRSEGRAYGDQDRSRNPGWSPANAHRAVRPAPTREPRSSRAAYRSLRGAHRGVHRRL